MRRGTVLLLVIVAAIISGCDRKCDQAGVVGRYELKQGVDHYELAFSSNGIGTMLLNQMEIGVFQWEIESATDQVFLQAPNSIFGVLQKLASRQPILSKDVDTRRGYFGLTPRCGSNGAANRLDIDVDGDRYFLRINNN